MSGSVMTSAMEQVMVRKHIFKIYILEPEDCMVNWLIGI